MTPQTDKGARNALILAIVGLFICGVLFGGFAIYEGTKARKRIAQSNGALTGDGMALAGIIIGILAILGSIAVGIWLTGRPVQTTRLR